MTKNLVKKIANDIGGVVKAAPVLIPAVFSLFSNNQLFAEVGDNDFGRTSDYNQSIVNIDYEGYENFFGFDYVSERPDSENGKELGGVTHSYEVMRKGNDFIVKEEGKPNTIFEFDVTSYWNATGKGDFLDSAKKEMEDAGYIIEMSDGFYDAFMSGFFEAFDSKKTLVKPSSLEEKTNNRFGVSLGGSTGNFLDSGSFSGPSLGFDFYGKNLGFGLDASILSSAEKDKILTEFQSGPSPYGIILQGSEIQKNAIMYNIGANLKLGGPINENLSLYGTVGFGARIFNRTNEVLEKILKNGDTLESNINSYQESNTTPYFKAGVDLISNNGLGVGLNGTMDSNKDWTVGANLKYSFPVGKNHRSQDRRGN